MSNRNIVLLASILLCVGAVAKAQNINAWGLSLFGSLSPDKKTGSIPDECGPQTAVLSPSVLFSSSDYEITACGSKVYFWNSTHMYGMGSNFGGGLGAGFGPTDTRCAGAQEIKAFRDAGEEVAGLSCNAATMIAWTKAGNVFGWGSNVNKQLGPTVLTLPHPIPLVTGFANVTDVVVGFGHVLARTAAAEVLCWGSNRKQQCASNLGSSIWPPLALTFDSTPIISVAIGYDHSLALSASGVAYAWGDNHFGQACQPSLAIVSETPPVSVQTRVHGAAFYGRAVTSIAAKKDSSYFLTSDGRLFGCGRNSGMGFNAPGYYVDRPREILVLPSDNLGSNTALSKIFARPTAYHTLAATRDLKLVGVGSNTAGELGFDLDTLMLKTWKSLINDSLPPVTQVSLAGYQSLVTTDASVTAPAPEVLRPECEIQGCVCPKPLDDAICVSGKWTAPNAIIWVNMTINQTIELTGNLTLAPGGSLTMPFGSTLQVKGCTQFYGGLINFTTTPEQLLQLSVSPLLIINSTCGDGAPVVILTVTGEQNPCSTVSIRTVEQNAGGYFILFDQTSCKKPLKLWIIGAVLGSIIGLVVVILLVVFFVRPVRRVVFPFFRRQERLEEERALNASTLSSPAASEPNSPRVTV